MPFLPINPDDLQKDLVRVSVNADLIGENALAFKKMMETSKISGKALVAQMIHYCLTEAAATPPKK